MNENHGTHSILDLGADTTPSDGIEKAAWERPAFQRINADEAESGIAPGPEIVILVS